MPGFPGIPRLSINLGLGGAFGVPQASAGSMLGVGYHVRPGFNTRFFDSPHVRHALDAVTYRVLLRFGQYVRGTARSILAAGQSTYGRAPQSPSDRSMSWGQAGLLRRFVAYGYDPHGGVVIGPELLKGSGVGFGPYGTVTVPQLLEYGGTVPMDRRSLRRFRRPEGTRATYRPMPYMGPAFEKGMGKLQKFYDDAYKKLAHVA